MNAIKRAARAAYRATLHTLYAITLTTAMLLLWASDWLGRQLK